VNTDTTVELSLIQCIASLASRYSKVILLTNHTASAFSYLTRGNKLVKLKLKARQVECIHLWRSVLFSSFANANILESPFRTVQLNDLEYQPQAGSFTRDHIYTDAASTPALTFGLFYPNHGWLYYDWADKELYNIATIEFLAHVIGFNFGLFLVKLLIIDYL
jgi:hypothetical protein